MSTYPFRSFPALLLAVVASLPAHAQEVTHPEGLAAPANEWRSVGGTPHATRYAAFADQITPDNVGKLQKVWEADLGLAPNSGARLQVTPIQVGSTLYACTNASILMALDGDTGKELWRFDPQQDLSGYYSENCRSVSYWESATPIDDCPARIIYATVDGRLVAVDAKTGKACEGFGDKGSVSLLKDMGPVKKNFHYSSSGPTIAGGVAVVGGWISDGQEVNEPSGVVRAYDVVSGELAWAFDPGRPDRQGPPPEGEIYTPGTPNAWGLFSADEALGMVYIPTGNATPDYWGAHRSENASKFSSSVVALDLATGKLRWHFQTVHHDIWDYDVASQPVLVDMKGPDGETIPALLQPTKRGQIFTLDRRDGTPIDPVEERPVPQGAAPGDTTSPTQPYTTRMPSFAGPVLTEADMWGISPIDQMWCRLEFRKLRYEGEFTPPSVNGSIEYPGYLGGMNWGSVAVHERRRIMVVNSSRMPNRVQLVPRAVADGMGWNAASAEGNMSVNMAVGAPQMGTPFAVTNGQFMSPLGVPCIKPPYALLSAVDLDTYELLWQEPLGSAKEAGPMGVASGLDLTMGVPMIGGTMVTETGLIFFGGSQDRTFRAFDLATGKQLWSDDLDIGASATPMTWVSPKTGRQYVALATGGAIMEAAPGNHLVAYALPLGKN